MPLTLHVDGDRWRSHLRSVLERQPSTVPVAKGNGYGLGLARLARRAAWLGVDTVAVGTYEEVETVATRFDGSVLVLTPWRPFMLTPSDPRLADRVVHTVSRLEDLEALMAAPGRPRVVLERRTSMVRHGFDAAGLREAGRRLAADRRHRTGDGVRVEGAALHLPLTRASHLAEVERLMSDVVAAGLRTPTVWVSHLGDAELAELASHYPDHVFRPRIGTGLWLGDRGALAVRSTVLDAHPLRRGEVYGYRGRAAGRSATLLVVSGGTAHGIGLEAPTGEGSLRARAATLARGGLDAMGLVRSPFTVAGKQRLFAEPPHMQASMLLLPADVEVPAVGAEVDVRVRFTATDVDQVSVK